MISEHTTKLFQELADFTVPMCAGTGPGACKVPHSCCSPEYCDLAEDIAGGHNITLKRERDDGLKFMSATGCTVPPHLRPMCTLHVCKINGMGTTGDLATDKKYFALRDQCVEVAFKEDLL